MFFAGRAVALLTIISPLSFGCGGPTAPNGRVDQAVPNAVELSEFAVLSKYRLKERLRDPDSAAYRNVRIYRHPKSDGGFVFCGEVNARNGFGGMAGFERFVASPTHAVIESMGPSAFVEGWEQFCPASRLVQPAPWF